MRIVLIIIMTFILLTSCSSNKKINYNQTKGDPRIHLQQGAIYLQELKCQEAVNEYLLFINKKKDSPESYNFLGLAYLCLKDYSSAKANFQKALSLDPLYYEVHNNLGILYMEINDLDNAEKEFLEFLKNKNINPSAAYYNLATLYLKKKDYQAALVTAKKCIQFQEESQEPYLLYLTILERAGKYDEALNEYKSFLIKFPNSQLGHYNYALLLLKYNLPCEAKNHFNKAMEIEPANETGLSAKQKIKLVKCSEN